MTTEIHTPAGPVRVGDILRYQTFGGTSRRIEVTNVEDDIKNGRPGFDGQMIDEYGRPWNDGMFGGACWGYADQVWWVSR